MSELIAPLPDLKFRLVTDSRHFSFFNNAGAIGGQPLFAQYLKDSKHPKYSITQINTYPTTTYAVQILTTLIYAWTSDSLFKGARWPPILFGGVSFVACLLLLHSPQPDLPSHLLTPYRR